MMFDENQLADAYTSAPKKIQEYITSPELGAVFEELRETHQLHLDEAGRLSNALNAVFLEVIPFDKFPKLLEEAVPQGEKRDALLKDVNEKVFVAFRQYLKEPEPEPEQTVPTPEVAAPEAPREVVIQKIPEKPPVQVATVVPQESVSPLKKLETSVRESPSDVAVGELISPTEATSGTPPPTRQSTDPYREPID